MISSTPVTALLSFAACSVLFGEDQLEDASGATAWGWVTMALPAIAGIVLFVVGSIRPMASGEGTLTAVMGTVAFVGLTLGIASILISGEGDASIGGGLLLLAGLASGGGVLYRTRTAWF